MKWIRIAIAAWLAFTFSSRPAASQDSPSSRFRPIGAPSAVDQYRGGGTGWRETALQVPVPRRAVGSSQAPVRQTAWLQQYNMPQIPGGGGMALPGSVPSNAAINANPGVNTTAPVPPTSVAPGAGFPGAGVPGAAFPGAGVPMTGTPLPSSLPAVPGGLPSSSDLTPVPAPRLNDGFATIDNCCCVSGPSGYVAASSPSGCAPVAYQAPATYQAPVMAAPPAAFATPGILPPTDRGQTGAPFGPLISFGQNANPVQVGPGLFGQPVAYVPGQTFRNWIRYIFP